MTTNNQAHQNHHQSPLSIQPTLSRVFHTYQSQWKHFTRLSVLSILPRLIPTILVQASIERVISDPVYLFHLTAQDVTLLKFGEFFWLLYLDWKDVNYNWKGIVGLLIVSMITAVWSRRRITTSVLMRNNSQQPTKTKKQPSSSPLLIPLVLTLGECVANTILPICLGSDALHLLWIAGVASKPICSCGLILSLFAALYVVAPFLLAYPVALENRQLSTIAALRRSYALTRQQGRFEVWFSHLVMLYLQVCAGQLLRTLFGGMIMLSLNWQVVLQQLPSLVFAPCFIILQTDLCLHSTAMSASEPKAHLAKKKLDVSKPVWSVQEEDSTTDEESSLDELSSKMV